MKKCICHFTNRRSQLEINGVLNQPKSVLSRVFIGLVLLIASAEEVMFLLRLFVCELSYTKTAGHITTKPGGGMWYVSGAEC